MGNKICSAVLFWTVFCLLFLLISPVFVPKNNDGSHGIHEVEAKGFLAEPENTIDVVFLGDSETFSAFIPLNIWQDHGITSYLCSTADQTMFQSAAYLDRFLETQDPKVVVLETNALYRAFTLSEMLSYQLQEKLPYLRYHDRWKTLTAKDWTSQVNFTHQEIYKGYAYRTAYEAADLTGYMDPSDEIAAVPFLSRGFARKILAACQERGAELILVSTPSPVNWDSYKHNGVAILAEELGVTYLDMNLMEKEIPIDWTIDTYDGGDHMNYRGACKVTDYMGAYLSDMDLFNDKREDPAYESWNDCLAAFQAERE